jgi:type VI secretion system secreted protein Hcp
MKAVLVGIVAGLASVGSFAPAVVRADAVYLSLKVNGVDLRGELGQDQFSRDGSIPCLYFEQGVQAAREAGTSLVVGRRQYSPLVIRKRIDRTSPLLMKALVDNAVVDAVFRFVRPNPKGDGTQLHYYTVAIRQGRLGSVKQISPDALDRQSAGLPQFEEITLVFQQIAWTYMDGGISMSDTWSAAR